MSTGRIRVYLLEREAKKGISLYLKFYPGIRDSRTNKLKFKESLGIYLYKKPKNEREKEYNREMRAHAEAIRDKYSLALFCEDNDIYDKSKLKEDFLSYFDNIVKQKKEDKLKSAYSYFNRFMNSKCTFGELNEDLCERFRDYLMTTSQLKNKNRKLANNTAASYFASFCSILKKANRDKWLKTKLTDHIDGIKEKETQREFLTLEELQLLANTPCKHPILKKASLFAALTGLRKGDILSLRWKHIQPAPLIEDGYNIRKNILKPDRNETMPLNPDALELCGERKNDEDLVFKGLKKEWTNKPFKEWIKSAEINRNITFHCLRHTNATLLLSSGADIYTIKGLLSHKHVKTTEIYTKIVDQNKLEASRLISLKKR